MRINTSLDLKHYLNSFVQNGFRVSALRRETNVYFTYKHDYLVKVMPPKGFVLSDDLNILAKELKLDDKHITPEYAKMPMFDFWLIILNPKNYKIQNIIKTKESS